MHNWFSKNLGDALTAAHTLAQIESLFEPMYADAGRRKDMAVFIRHESEGRLQCDVLVYFSPAATELAQTLDATPCNRPSKDNLSLLHGDERAWSMLHPEK